MIDDIRIDEKYINYKVSYTYRQILIGLRNEFLQYQEKLDELSKYICAYEETMGINKEKRDRYYFDLYIEPYKKDILPELSLIRRPIRQRLLEKLRLSYSPTRTIMVKDNNGIYYPLRKPSFEDYQFNVYVKPGMEKEFQERVEEILNSDFAKYMQLSDNISSNLGSPITSLSNSWITPNLTSIGFDLCTSKSQFKYLGRHDIIRFASARRHNEKWEPLTQEHLDYVSKIQFPKDAFSLYQQSIIEKNIDDERTIVLSESYEPSILANFKIEDEEKKLVLTKTKSK